MAPPRSAATALWDAVSQFTLRAVDEDYPLRVHVPGNLIGIVRYRQWREAEGQPRQWLYDALVSCFTSAQGGGIAARCLLEGKLPVQYFAGSHNVVYVQALTYFLTYWSPRDVVYRSLSTPRHPLRIFCSMMDSFDGITTLCGLVDTSRKEFPGNFLMPFMANAALFNGGSFFTYLDARARGKDVKVFLADPDSSLTRCAILTLAYWYLGYRFLGGKHRNMAVVILCVSYALFELFEDIIDHDFFEDAHKPVVQLLRIFRAVFQLGPAKKDRTKEIAG